MRVSVFLAAAVVSGAANASEIDIDVENFTARNGLSELVLKVSNDTSVNFEKVYIDCAFLDKDMRALDVGRAVVRGLSAGAHVYEKASVPVSDGVAHAQCRVKDSW